MNRRAAAVVRIVLRLVAMVFAGTVSTCIGRKLLDQVGKQQICAFNASSSLPCDIGIACGAFTICIALIFTILDVVCDALRRELSTLGKISLASSVAASSHLAILWLSCFVYLTYEWLDDAGDEVDEEFGDGVLSVVKVVQAFSCLSIFGWIAVAINGITVLRNLHLRIYRPVVDIEDLPPRYSDR